MIEDTSKEIAGYQNRVAELQEEMDEKDKLLSNQKSMLEKMMVIGDGMMVTVRRIEARLEGKGIEKTSDEGGVSLT